MVRCDVFYVKNKGYYFIPVYVADTVKASLPNKACVSGNREWEKMKDDDFVFSLYPNDLFKYYSKKAVPLSVLNKGGTLEEKLAFPAENDLFLYFKGLDISTAALSGITNDNTYKCRSIGKTALKLEKYEVDILGNVRKAGFEKRKSFDLNKKKV